MFALLWAASVPSLPAADDPGAADRRERLMTHGINADAGSLIRFLREGFDLKILPKGLPKEPLLKSGLAGDAIAELGTAGAKPAVDVLEQIAERRFPKGLGQVIARDFEAVPLELAEQQKPTLERLLSLNAIVALGLIGEERSAPAILGVMRTEPGTAFVTKGAVALGQLGSAEGLPSLVLLASDPASPDCVAAFEAIYVLTGRNYGITENTSLARRRKAIDELRAWFQKEAAALRVYREDVNRRAENPPLPPAPDPSSLRGQLRATQDAANYDARYAARETLRSTAAARFDELKAIAQDPLEDLDIRRAAMTYLSAADPKKARSPIRKLRKDENPRIAEIANELVKDIDQAIAYQKKAN